MQTPPDKMGLVNDVGAGHTHGLASKLMKSNTNNRTPRRKAQQLRPPPKKKLNLQKTVSTDTFLSREENASGAKEGPSYFESNRYDSNTLGLSLDSNKPPVDHLYLTPRDTSDAKSTHSNITPRSLLSNEEDEAPTDQKDINNPIQEEKQIVKPVFTVEGQIPNGHSREFDVSRGADSVSRQPSVGSVESTKLKQDSVGARRKAVYDRPQSSASTWRENTMRGPTYHYWAKETYFDCEFYIYGHKYQSEYQHQQKIVY